MSSVDKAGIQVKNLKAIGKGYGKFQFSSLQFLSPSFSPVRSTQSGEYVSI
jgi:hypothetical protein